MSLKDIFKKKVMEDVSTGSLAINPTVMSDMQKRILAKEAGVDNTKAPDPKEVRQNLAKRIEFEKENIVPYGVQLADGDVLRLYIPKVNEDQVIETVNVLIGLHTELTTKLVISKVKHLIKAYDVLKATAQTPVLYGVGDDDKLEKKPG